MFYQTRTSYSPKKRDLTNPNKWSGKPLDNIASKPISSIIVNRLTKHLAKAGIDEQCGSMFNKGCADVTFAVKLALRILHEHNTEVFSLFIDLVKHMTL